MEMTEKYKVTQKFIEELNKWRDENNLNPKSGALYAFLDGRDIKHVPNIIDAWWTEPDNPTENNHRLITIIQWLNGEDVFEVEEPHKFVVRSEMPNADGDYVYVLAEYAVTNTVYSLNDATKFNTELEAQEWANSHQVVVEIDEYENKVE